MHGAQALAAGIGAQAWTGVAPTGGGAGEPVARGAGTRAGFSSCAQETSNGATRMPHSRMAERYMFDGGMWIIFLEMGAVLLLGVFIVWWTWPRPKKPAQRPLAGDAEKSDPDA